MRTFGNQANGQTKRRRFCLGLVSIDGCCESGGKLSAPVSPREAGRLAAERALYLLADYLSASLRLIGDDGSHSGGNLIATQTAQLAANLWPRASAPRAANLPARMLRCIWLVSSLLSSSFHPADLLNFYFLLSSSKTRIKIKGSQQTGEH